MLPLLSMERRAGSSRQQRHAPCKLLRASAPLMLMWQPCQQTHLRATEGSTHKRQEALSASIALSRQWCRRHPKLEVMQVEQAAVLRRAPRAIQARPAAAQRAAVVEVADEVVTARPVHPAPAPAAIAAAAAVADADDPVVAARAPAAARALAVVVPATRQPRDSWGSGRQTRSHRVSS